MKQTTTEETGGLRDAGLPMSLITLRRKLAVKAKQEPKFRFYSLYGHICRDDVLEAAWGRVRANKGAPGVDGVTLQSVEKSEGGVAKFLLGIRQDLRARSYKPLPVRRVHIPKSPGKTRPLGIPTVRDRVVQMATLLVIEPIFESDFEDCSYGFRPGRSAHDALGAIQGHLREGFRSVYDADLAGYFDSIPHDKLMLCLRKRIVDGRVLKMIRMWLQAPVIELVVKGDKTGKGSGGGGASPRQEKGTPQGGVISPLLANVYLHWFDKVFHREGGPFHWANARLVRYADDFVVMARFVDYRIEGWVEKKLENWLGLKINREKTSVVNLREPGVSLDFLGYTFRYDRDLYGRDRSYLNVFPSKKSLSRERIKLREMTSSRMCFKPIPQLIGELNRHLRGWSNYFRFGYSNMAMREINHYTRTRLWCHLRRRSQRPWQPPKGTTHYAQFAKMGLVSL